MQVGLRVRLRVLQVMLIGRAAHEALAAGCTAEPLSVCVDAGVDLHQVGADHLVAGGALLSGWGAEVESGRGDR